MDKTHKEFTDRSFDMEAALSGSPVCTRKGWSVTGLQINPDDGDEVYRLKGTVHYPDYPCTETFTEDGKFSVGKETHCDLFMAEEKGN